MTSRNDTWNIAAEILTERQLEVLQLHDRGLSYRLIALHLGISPQRASRIVERAAQKLTLELERRATT